MHNLVMQRQKQKKDEQPAMMTVNEVSSYLSLSARSVYRLVGDLPAIRVGGRWRFRVSDVEEWLLQQRKSSEPTLEPVVGLGSQIRLLPHIDETNIFLDVADRDAPGLIRSAILRARLNLTESPEESAKERLLTSILEREVLCSTALHPDVAFPHPRDPERCPLGADQILVVRALLPVDFREIHGYQPRIIFVLLARTVSLQLVWEARLSHLLHRKDFVQKLLSASSAHEVLETFEPGDQASSVDIVSV
jgi:excisionase family DNA binding protein